MYGQLPTSIWTTTLTMGNAVEADPEAGANLDGYEDRPFTSLVAAAIIDSNACIVSFALEQGADRDGPVIRQVGAITIANWR